MARTAEVIYVGDAASLIQASQDAADAVSDASDAIAGANDAIAGSYGEALVAAKDAYASAAKGAAVLGGSLEEQAAAASVAAWMNKAVSTSSAYVEAELQGLLDWLVTEFEAEVDVE